MTQEPYFHEESGTVRFWVPVDGQLIGCSVSRETLHYRYRPGAQGENPLETYASNVDSLRAAVQRRVARGSIEPVMLRENDLYDRAEGDPAKTVR